MWQDEPAGSAAPGGRGSGRGEGPRASRRNGLLAFFERRIGRRAGRRRSARVGGGLQLACNRLQSGGNEPSYQIAFFSRFKLSASSNTNFAFLGCSVKCSPAIGYMPVAEKNGERRSHLKLSLHLKKRPIRELARGPSPCSTLGRPAPPNPRVPHGPMRRSRFYCNWHVTDCRVPFQLL